MNVFSLLDEATRRFPEHGAVFSGTTHKQTYRALHARASRFSPRLEAGARVAVVTENRPEYLEIMFGVWHAGLALVPVNAKLHPREMKEILEDAGASLVLVSESLREGLGLGVTIGSADYEALFAPDATPAAEVAPDDLAWLFFTSGTTGRSKGAMLTHRNLIAMTTCHLADVDVIDEHASQIHAAPMSHGSGLYAPIYLSRGARQVIPASGHFEPSEFLDLCDAHPNVGAFLAPTMVQRLRLEAESRDRTPKNLRSIIYGGGPMYTDDLRRSLARFGQVFVQIYGQGETPMTITSLRRSDHESTQNDVLGSVGWARTGVEVRVVDDADNPLPTGEVGEIVCRSDIVMKGYWQNPDATEKTLRGGWLHTGDLGSFDARGYLTLRGRAKEVVISGGSNIYPREVEEVLQAHPDVLEAAVVGQRDEEWGEVVVAFVVTRRPLEASALDAHCLAQLARFKRPKHYHFVETLPKNNYGKVVKRELESRLLANDRGSGNG